MALRTLTILSVLGASMTTQLIQNLMLSSSIQKPSEVTETARTRHSL
jgi:hypothetical protein